MRQNVQALNEHIERLIEAGEAAPADIARVIETHISTVDVALVNRMARLHPTNDAVQRLLFLHENGDVELIATYLEYIAANTAALVSTRIIGEVYQRLLDILPHTRARRALVAACGQGGERAALLQLLPFLDDPIEVATVLAALAPNALGKAGAEVEARWPDGAPAEVYAVLLESPSHAFRLWLIERARAAIKPAREAHAKPALRR